MSSTLGHLPPTKLDHGLLALRDRDDGLDELWKSRVFILGIHSDTDTTLERAGAEEEVVVFADVVEGDLDGGGVGFSVRDGRGARRERIVEEELVGEREVVGGACGGDRDAVDMFREGVEHISSLEQMDDEEQREQSENHKADRTSPLSHLCTSRVLTRRTILLQTTRGTTSTDTSKDSTAATTTTGASGALFLWASLDLIYIDHDPVWIV